MIVVPTYYNRDFDDSTASNECAELNDVIAVLNLRQIHENEHCIKQTWPCLHETTDCVCASTRPGRYD
jgi:hypothetical protein